MVEAPANVWGESTDDIEQSFKMDGAALTYTPPKAGSSGNAHVYKVGCGTTCIREVQYSPVLLVPRLNKHIWVSAIKLRALIVVRLRLLNLRATDRYFRGPLSPCMMQIRHTLIRRVRK